MEDFVCPWLFQVFHWVTCAYTLPPCLSRWSAIHVPRCVLGPHGGPEPRLVVRRPQRCSTSLHSSDGRRSHGWRQWDLSRKPRAPKTKAIQRTPCPNKNQGVCVCVRLCMYKSQIFVRSKSLFFPWVLESNGDLCFWRSRNATLPKCSWSLQVSGRFLFGLVFICRFFGLLGGAKILHHICLLATGLSSTWNLPSSKTMGRQGRCHLIILAHFGRGPPNFHHQMDGFGNPKMDTQKNV